MSIKWMLGAGICFISLTAEAGLVTRTYTYTTGNTINSTENNTNENTLYNELNGNIDSANIKAAGVATSDLADGSVTTAKLDSSVTISSLAVTNLVLGGLANFGKIKQVVCSSETVGGSTTSSTFVIVGGTTTITISSTTSKVLLFGSGFLNDSTNTDSHSAVLGFARNGTALFSRAVSPFFYQTGGTTSAFGMTVTAFWLDSPASTSATSYALMFASGAGSTVNFGNAAATGSTSIICAAEILNSLNP